MTLQFCAYLFPWKKLAAANSILKRDLKNVFISDNDFAFQVLPDADPQEIFLAVILRKIIADDCRIEREQIASNYPLKDLESLMQDTTFLGWIWGGFLWNGYDYDRVRMRLWDYVDTIYGKRTPYIFTSDKLYYILTFSQLENPIFFTNPSFGNWVRLVVQEINRILLDNGIIFSEEQCHSFDIKAAS